MMIHNIKQMKGRSLVLVAWLTAVTALLTMGCADYDNPVATGQGGIYTMAVSASKGGGAATRALTDDGDGTLTATWQTSDNVWVKNGEAWSTAALHPENAGTTATLKGTLTGLTIATGNELTLQFPSKEVDYTGQVGTLPDIAAKYDYATATTTVTTVSGSNISANPVTFSNQQAIVKFTLQTPDETALSASTLTVSATGLKTTDTATGDVTITPEEPTSEIYAALSGISASTVTLSATVGRDTYSFEKSGMTSTNGKYYDVTVKMEKLPRAPVDLSTLAADYTMQDGDVLTGTLEQKVKIIIADGATVTLRDADINGSGTLSKSSAGITLLGDATIVLEGENAVRSFEYSYPAIYVPEGKTLTISGEGALDANAGSGRSAGIGAGMLNHGGNIIIEGGDIKATGGTYSAGIGGSDYKSCGNIEIRGGNVTATGGRHGAGIGSGDGVQCGNITISGGTISATGGERAAGIGSGAYGKCGNVTIENTVTSVTATLGTGSLNSIGKSYESGTSGTVTIGGTVYYDGSDYQNDGATYLATSPLIYPAPHYLTDADPDDIGKIVGANGIIYDTKEDAEAASTTAVAMIAYVGDDAETNSTYRNGLALALNDVSGKKTWCSQSSETCLGTRYSLESAAKDDMAGIANTDALVNHTSHTHAVAIAARNHKYADGVAEGDHPDGTSAWFLPSAGQWDKMITAAGGYANLKANADLRSGRYWSSSEYSYSYAWYFSTDSGGYWSGGLKTLDDYFVRACLAF